MTTTKEINFKKYVREWFPLDDDLSTHYHIEAPNTAEVCIEKTISDLENTSKSFEFFVVREDKKDIGFFGVEKIDGLNILTTIFVKPEYRKKEYMTDFWNGILNVFHHTAFCVGVYEKNTRAIKFYHRNGGTLLAKKDNFFVFYFGDRICQ